MKLNYKRTLLVGFAFLSICAFWQLYDNVIPLILKNTFHMKDSLHSGRHGCGGHPDEHPALCGQS